MILSLVSPWSEILIWFVIVVLAVIVEINTVPLISIWFAVSGVISMILSAFGCKIEIQIIVFIILSAILLCVSRIFIKKLNKIKVDDASANSLIGEIVYVTKEIPIDGVGEIKAKYEKYSAIAPNVSECIEIDTKVKIIEIRGNKVIVELI